MDDNFVNALKEFNKLSDEEKNKIADSLGIIIKNKKEDRGKLFKQACTNFIDNVFPSICELLQSCNFPGPFSITIGVDINGEFFHRMNRIRKKYGPRKKK